MTLLVWMQQAIAGRIFLAGEHVSPPFFGYMEGALQSGLAAACRIAIACAHINSGVAWDTCEAGCPTSHSVSIAANSACKVAGASTRTGAISL